MNPSRTSSRILSSSIASFMVAAGFFGPAAPSHAATIYWDGADLASWNAAASWSTTSSGAGGLDQLPLATDIAQFSITSINTPRTVNLNANQSVAGLIFSSTGTTLLQGGGTNRTLTLGSSGIVVNASAGVPTIGSAAAGQNVAVTMGAAQPWTNNSSSLLSVVNNVANGGFLLTSTGTGSTTIGGIVSGGGGITKTGAGTLTLSGANSYTGTTTVSTGILRATTVAGALGGGGLTMSGGTLQLANNGGLTFGRNTTVTASSTISADRIAAAVTSTTHTLGTLAIGAQTLSITRGANITGTAIGGVTFGTTTMSGASTFDPQANATLTLGTVHGGANGITKTGAGTLVLSGASTHTGDTTVASGVLQINNNNGAGNGAITIASGAVAANRVLVNSGVTIFNPISFGTTLGTAGAGVIQHTTPAGIIGQATVNGPITITGAPVGGGHFVGGAAVGNELVLGGAINSTVSLSQRDGRVIYKGGGTVTAVNPQLTVTNTALIGATNGMPTMLTPFLGGSGSATLDLNGFDQALAGLLLGNAGNANVGTVNVGAKTLTLTGDVNTQTPGGSTGAHSINGTAGGTLNFGGTTRTFNVSDSLSADDLTLNGVTVVGAGGVVKEGPGTLSLTNGTAIAGTLTINNGGLQAGTSGSGGTFSSGALTFTANPTTLLMKVGTGGDLINTGTLTTQGIGTTAVNLSQIGGALTAGDKILIDYTGTGPGVGGFALGVLPGRLAGTLFDTGSAIVLRVTGNDEVIWDGINGPTWSEGATGNWKLLSTNLQNDYLAGDVVRFQNSPASNSVDIGVDVAPSHVTFSNTLAVTSDYFVTGTAGIAGPTSVVKSGDGNVTLTNPNSYTGATTVSAGILELDHDATGNVVLSGTSGVSVAGGATVKLTRDDGAFTFNRNLSGAGAVQINPHSAGGAASLGVTLSGDNTGFTGQMTLLAPVSGTYRLTNVTPAALGGATINVESGAQVFTAANQTYNNAITIAGTGYADTSGNIGALRLDGGSNWAGPVSVNGAARIGAFNSTATVSGSITGGDLEVNATNYNNGFTLIFTGTNSYSTTTIGGQNTQTAGVPSMRLNIGNGGTTGTLGSGPVIINGDGANGVLGFDRSDGYTLAPFQTITAASGLGAIANSIARTFIDFDTLGAGFSDGGNAITLGSPLLASGGQFRVGQSRAGAVASFTGAMTGGTFRIGSNAANATANLNNGAVANFERVHVGLFATTSTSTLNINSGATLNADYMTGGEVASHSGNINQAAGSIVNVASQLRLGHFGTETSTYNMSGGTLTLTGASPINTPSTAGAGAAGTTGDNNINATNPTTIVGGGIYLGIDGTGIFNHTGGAVTTNWIVLDNRGDSGANVNGQDGIDRYTINGAGASLSLRSTYGLIQRNASSAVVFGTGTVRVDNTGTGTGTGANLTIPLDATIDTITGTTTTLDTNGAGNGLTLTRDVRGSGTLNLAGGGTISATTGGVQSISAGISGNTGLTKLGTGTTTLTGSAAGYTGAVTVSAGRLNVSPSLATAVTVADGAALGGEPAGITALTLGTAGGSTVFFDPNTAGALTTGTLTVNGANFLDLTALPLGAGPYTAINYTTLLGGGAFSVANAANYRVAPAVGNTGSAITVNITGSKSLTWTGATDAAWNINSAVNWNGPAPDVFFSADTVTFPEGGANSTIALTGLLAPFGIAVTADTTPYTFTATAGNQIVGGVGITKTNGGTLTLTGANAHSGPTSIGGGTVEINGTNSIGNASVTNTIAISNGARLSHVGATALDLGVNRSIAIGVGGGSISHNNATGAAISIPGNITGTEPLSFHSNAAGTGTFVLSGNNAGYNGAISVDAPISSTGGLTVLRLATQSAVPAGGSITLNYPASGVNTNATTLDLPGITLPAGITVNMTSLLNGALSLRSQITSPGTSVINGPITVSGNTIAQISPTGSIVLNGPVTDNGFSGTFFLRNTGTITVNNAITLPGGFVSRTDAGLAILNSTGNDWLSTGVLVGTLRMGAAGALPANAALVMGQNDGNTATLDLNGFDQTAISLASNPVITNANSVGKSITSATPATLTINQFTDTNYASLLTGELALNKTDTGRLTLLGANSHNGLTLISAGVIAIQHRTALGSVTAGTVVANLATLEMQGNILVGAEALTINGTGAFGTGALVSVSGTNTYGGLVTVATNATIAALSGSTLNLNGGVDKTATTVTFTGGGSINVNSQPVFGSVSGSDVIVDGVALSLNVASTYNGPTFVKNGGLLVNGANQAVPNVSKVTLGDAATNTDGTWFVNGTTQTIAGLASAGTGNKSIDLGSGALTVNQSADTEYDGAITGTGSLEKTGVGNLALQALNGTLDFSTLTVSDGSLDLHSPLGTGTSIINATAEINLTVSQTLGELNIGEGGIVNLGALPPPSPALAGAGEELFAADAGFAGANAPVQPVPEPGSAMLLFGGMLTLLGLRRRGA